jgi:hypothetical protein
LASSSSDKKEPVMNNIFAFHGKYTNLFEKGKEQNDDSFYEKLATLNHKNNGKLHKGDISSVHNDSSMSMKEEHFINTDVLNMLNSSTSIANVCILIKNRKNNPNRFHQSLFPITAMTLVLIKRLRK